MPEESWDKPVPPLRIALVGKMHSGKGVASDWLVNRFGFTRLALADPVKDASVVGVNAILEFLKKDLRITRHDLEVHKTQFRLMPQFVGTNLGREFLGYDCIWIDKLLDRVYLTDGDVVVDDCRFLNEAAALREHGFTIVNLHRPEGMRIQSLLAKLVESNPTIDLETAFAKLREMTSHPSETEVDQIEADFYLANEGSVAEFENRITLLVQRMSKYAGT